MNSPDWAGASALPPLPPGSASSSLRSRGYGSRRRFSPAEQAALSRRPAHITGYLSSPGPPARHGGGLRSAPGSADSITDQPPAEGDVAGNPALLDSDAESRAASTPALRSELSEASWPSQAAGGWSALLEGSLNSQSSDPQFDQDQVRAVLDRLLPAGQEQKALHSAGPWHTREPTPERSSSMPLLLPALGSSGGPGVQEEGSSPKDSASSCQRPESSSSIARQDDGGVAKGHLGPHRGKSVRSRNASPVPGPFASPSASPAPSATPPTGGIRRSSKAGNRRCVSRGPRFPKAALDRFRLRLLRRHQSLHDAIGRHAGRASFEKPLGAQELRHALVRLFEGEDEVDELMASMSESWTCSMSLSSLIGELMGASPTAPLWELRCRLVSNGIWPLHDELPKVFALIEKKRGQLQKGEESSAAAAVRACPTPSRQSAAGEKRRSQPKQSELGREQWLDFTEALGICASEAKRLLTMLWSGSKRNQAIDLLVLSRTMIGTVSPDVSLPWFVEKLLECYGSLRTAYRQAALASSDGQLRFEQFQKLARSVGVSPSNVDKVWAVLHPNAAETDVALCLSEEAFAGELVQWASPAALSDFRQQLCANFGSLHEGRKALRQHGLPGGYSLSPRHFHAGLQAAGLDRCDGDAALHLVRRTREPGEPQRVTLDDIIAATHDVYWGTSGVDPVADAVQPLWQQLNAMRLDLAQDASRRSSKATSEGWNSAVDGGEKSPSSPSHRSGGTVSVVDLDIVAGGRGRPANVLLEASSAAPENFDLGPALSFRRTLSRASSRGSLGVASVPSRLSSRASSKDDFGQGRAELHTIRPCRDGSRSSLQRHPSHAE
eukprot:TRINITY_DN33030_c0_g1_i1.p1 TRINITY_DN33030_c0_g1~~TRINITY_DN33030_c0_g1_i1.p1  ORF type:complete len:838 (+),score=158.91 TRINITY_DN33030_c0_g1_i1:59-2572(+)